MCKQPFSTISIMFFSRETRRSTRYSRNGSAVNGGNLGYTADSSEHICNQQRSSSSQLERPHHRNSYTSSVGSSNCSTRSGQHTNLLRCILQAQVKFLDIEKLHLNCYQLMNYYHIGRSNNSYTSSRSTHSHGGKSARSRRYAAGEGDRYERGTHPYIPSSGSTQCAPNSGHLSSRHQYREENSSSERYTEVL